MLVTLGTAVSPTLMNSAVTRPVERRADLGLREAFPRLPQLRLGLAQHLVGVAQLDLRELMVRCDVIERVRVDDALFAQRLVTPEARCLRRSRDLLPLDREARLRERGVELRNFGERRRRIEAQQKIALPDAIALLHQQLLHASDNLGDELDLRLVRQGARSEDGRRQHALADQLRLDIADFTATAQPSDHRYRHQHDDQQRDSIAQRGLHERPSAYQSAPPPKSTSGVALTSTA